LWLYLLFLFVTCQGTVRFSFLALQGRIYGRRFFPDIVDFLLSALLFWVVLLTEHFFFSPHEAFGLRFFVCWSQDRRRYRRVSRFHPRGQATPPPFFLDAGCTWSGGFDFFPSEPGLSLRAENSEWRRVPCTLPPPFPVATRTPLVRTPDFLGGPSCGPWVPLSFSCLRADNGVPAFFSSDPRFLSG